jgi:predicted nuclease of predicted toxin-antitoxin system
MKLCWLQARSSRGSLRNSESNNLHPKPTTTLSHHQLIAYQLSIELLGLFRSLRSSRSPTPSRRPKPNLQGATSLAPRFFDQSWDTRIARRGTARHKVDENIHPAVTEALRTEGKDVLTVMEARLGGRPDEDVLRPAASQRRVAVTQDSDFGGLVVHGGLAFPGIVYLRPGHREPSVVMQSLQAIQETVGALRPGFVVVAEHRNTQVRIRVRIVAT